MTEKILYFLLFFSILYLIRQGYFLLGLILFEQEHTFTVDDAIFSALSLCYILTIIFTGLSC